jgi:catalase
MAMLNVPMFGAMHPQTFLDLMLAARADPATGRPDPEKLKAFRETHPDSHAQGGYMAANNPPAAYTSASYWGIHTFMLVDRADKQTPVRWRFVPQDGEKRLTDDEMKAAPADFLEPALIARTGKGPVRWDMMVSIGEAGDSLDNPTLTWPDSRRQIRAGTLTIVAATPQKGATCEAVNFDPMVMAPGIAATADPVLRFRSPSYAVSFGRRLSGQ